MKFAIPSILVLALFSVPHAVFSRVEDSAKPVLRSPHYRLVVVGAGTSFTATLTALNNIGEIAGRYFAPGPDSYPAETVTIKDSEPRILRVPGFTNSWPTGLNDRGELTLNAWNGSSSPGPQANGRDYRSYLWTGHRPLPVAALHATKYVTATALSDSGVIVGYTGGDRTDRYGEEDYTAFVDHHGITKALPTLCGPHAQALAVNDHGEIVGQADLRMPKFETHACLWRHGRAIDLGTLGGANSSACAINDRGQVVGSADTMFVNPQTIYLTTHAFLWQHGHMTDLGTLGGPYSYATAINDHGEIVGDAYTGGPKPTDLGNDFAVLWRGGHIFTLDSLVTNLNGAVLTAAYAVNNRGEILAGGMKPNHGQDHSFLLIPVGQPTMYAKRLAQIRLPGAPAKSSK